MCHNTRGTAWPAARHLLDSKHRRRSCAGSFNCSPPMQLTLLIPDAVPLAVPESSDTGDGRVLRQWLSRGELQRHPASAPEIWLCRAFEVEEREDWPAAALTASFDGLDTGDSWWLRADPVSLQLQRSGSALLGAPALNLSGEEVQALTGHLNRHFAAESLQFEAPHPMRWYLRLTTAPQIRGPLPMAVAGGSAPAMPFSGARASDWHRILTEAQMLLHDHPVNRAREARGEPVINSLLLWGGGRKPAVPGRLFTHVWSHDPLAGALAVHSGAEQLPAPENAARWLAQRGEPDSRHLIVLDTLHQAARYGTAAQWSAAADRLDELWFGPLTASLGGRLDQLQIAITSPAGNLHCTVRASTRWRFWRRTQSWQALTSGN